jgi:5-methyltetrahydropteroyltriglutamate--homocysteine methyltransferase
MRPSWLDELYQDLTRGTVSDDELDVAQERAVREVIARQEAIGLPVVTDGELRRLGNFQDSFATAISGFDAVAVGSAEYLESVAAEQVEIARLYARKPGRRIESGIAKTRGRGRAVTNRLPVKERLKLERNVILDEYRLASSIATVPVKVTLIGPDRISQRYAYEDSRDVYADMDEFISDVVAIERRMIAEVVDAGCRYVQIDEPGFTAYVDPPLLAQMRARGEDPMANLERSIRANNALIEGFPGVTFAVHVCRGGTGGRGGPGAHREGSYEAIAERLFSGLEYRRFLLEYDSDEAGSLDAIRFLNDGKIAVLGVVSNNDPEVETAEYVKRRLEDASRVLPFEQLALCPRCGFNGVAEQVQWAKLKVLADVALELWSVGPGGQLEQ